MFYASYNYMNSEVYGFSNKQARDYWVDHSVFLERVPVTRSQVEILCGRANICNKTFDNEAQVFIIENKLMR